MDGAQIEQLLQAIASQVTERWRQSRLAREAPSDLCIIGIRRGGVGVARRLRSLLGDALGAPPSFGTLDISLYRDDVAENGVPVVGVTEIPFPVSGKLILLVDDVLYTGRTVRAALDELMGFGRPRAVWLAALVDRGGRELPIRADFVGRTLAVSADEDVRVRVGDDVAMGTIDVVRRSRKR